MTLRQLALPFAHRPHLTAAEFLEAPSNADAMAWLARSADWPMGRLALCGEGSVGKTHLLHIWAARVGAVVLDGPTLTFAPPVTPVAIDDADAAPSNALLHVLNAAVEARQPVLLAAREAPARWPAQWRVALADLSSRLRATTAIAIAPPEEALLRSLLMRLLAERQLAVPEAVQEWMLARLPRTPQALHEAAARFDHASMAAGSSGPRAIAARVIAAMREDGENADLPWSHDEDFAQPLGVVSRVGPGLL